MRGLIVMAMFAASLAEAGWKDYEEQRDLSLDADGLESIEIDAGAGSLFVQGVEGKDDITVKATIVVDDADEDEAQKIIAKKLVLKLDRSGREARLDAYFDNSGWGWNSGASVHLEVEMPANLDMFVDDGSGSIDVLDVLADVRIDDGSGSIDIRNVGGVEVDDGSGSISIATVAGDVDIIDGSGSINVRGVSGSVTIDDGSGSIRVNDVEQDLIIVDDGSGGVDFNNVRGRVEQDD